jgi:hypothetical protein
VSVTFRCTACGERWEPEATDNGRSYRRHLAECAEHLAGRSVLVDGCWPDGPQAGRKPRDSNASRRVKEEAEREPADTDVLMTEHVADLMEQRPYR